MYHSGNRALQQQFGSVALADRLFEKLHRERFSDADKQFIEGLGCFFLATADAEGRPDCSFKGGAPGFARVVSPELLVFPDYDGNGMFKSLGNIAVNPNVGLLFIAMQEAPKRLRVNGTAQLILKMINQVGITLFAPIQHVGRAWSRGFHGGSLQVMKLGPKDCEFEVIDRSSA